LRLRRAADVAVVESADLRHCHDIAALGWLDRAWLGRVLPESEMRAQGVIVGEVIAKATTEVSFVQHDHVVEQFAPDGADHALSEWPASSLPPEVPVSIPYPLGSNHRVGRYPTAVASRNCVHPLLLLPPRDQL